MSTIGKTTLLTLPAMLVGLWLLQGPIFLTEDSLPGSPVRTPQVNSVNGEQSAGPGSFGDQKSTAEDYQQPISTRPVVSTKAIAPSKRLQADDWRLNFYPELARIAELESLSPDNAVGELVPMLSDSDPAIRLAAIDSLSQMRHPAALAAFNAALEDPNPQIRIVAIEALADQDDNSTHGSIEPLLYDPVSEVRLAAIDALGELEVTAAVPSLAGLLSDEDPAIRQRSVNALGEIGGELASLYLEQMRYDPTESIRINALAILDEIRANARH